MRPQNEEARRAKQIEIMENSFNCYAENGFSSVGIKAIAKACDCNSFYTDRGKSVLCIAVEAVFHNLNLLMPAAFFILRAQYITSFLVT